MKVVAVSQRIDEIPIRKETRDALDHRLTSFVLEAGFIPVPVPNGLIQPRLQGSSRGAPLEAWLGRLQPDAIVLSGGNDVGECLARDQTETCLLDYACINQLPVLGICRGMQMMAHWSGGRLRRVEGHVATRHTLVGEIAREVNSYHDYSISVSPDGFMVLAQSTDGVIEALRHQNLPWEGWMWHPEREVSSARMQDIIRVRALFA